MAAIIDVSGDRRLQLGGEEFVRQFNFGHRWQKMSIGWQFAANAIQPYYGKFGTGLCEGSEGYSAPVSTGVIGTFPGAVATGASWSAATGGYSNVGATRQPFNKKGSTVTVGSALGTGTTVMISTLYYNTPNTLSMWIMQLERSTTDWNTITLKMAMSASAQIGQSVDLFTFYKNLENDTGQGYYGVPNQDGGSTHTYVGFLDNFWLFWDRTCPTIEISRIGVVRSA